MHPDRLLRSSGVLPAVCLALAILVLCPTAEAANRRFRFGPLEIAPTAGVGFRYHGNVYVLSDSQQDVADQRGVSTSGPLVDLTAGIGVRLVPKQFEEAVQIKGAFFDAYYRPNFIIFPSASTNFDLFGDNSSWRDPDKRPDLFKLTHTFGAFLRYHFGPRLSASAGIEGDQPEVSAVDDRFFDLRAKAGAKWFPSDLIGVEANLVYRDFTERARSVSGDKIDGPLGTFTDLEGNLATYWVQSPTLRFVVDGKYRQREFNYDANIHPDYSIPGRPANDFDNNGVADVRKDYTEWEANGRAQKRLSRNIEAQGYVGYVDRVWDSRQFGKERADNLVGGGWISSLLSRRTKLQFSAEYKLTDTIRGLTFEDINAFSSDELGAFTVITNSYGEVWSQRYLLDLSHQVSQRGDQILVGLAYQADDLKDQQGTSNLFVAIQDEPWPIGGNREDAVRDLVPTGDPSYPCVAGQFCFPLLPDSTQNQFIVSGGYRYRMKDWLGLQARVTYYDKHEDVEPKYGLQRIYDSNGNPVDIDQADMNRIIVQPARIIDTQYLSFSGGVVLNFY